MAYKIAVVVGSIRQGSFNKQLAHALISLAPSDFSFELLDIASLPLYSQDYDDNYPEPARVLKQKISEANGLLFVTPEYNRSIPGVLKNALDGGRVRGGTAPGSTSRARSSARRWAQSEPRSRRRTCATCSPIWMCR
jgi:NAD(P)H-dependent FMN reductase